jgi:hypothetical protein
MSLVELLRYTKVYRILGVKGTRVVLEHQAACIHGRLGLRGERIEVTAVLPVEIMMWDDVRLVRRSWVERLFTLPWRPGTKYKIARA